MNSGNGTGLSERALGVFGWITIAFWISMAVFPQWIPPLAPWPDIAGSLHGVPNWMRQQAGLDLPDQELVTSLNRDLLAVYAVHWSEIAIGVASGVLLVLRKRAGRGLALFLCAALLGWWGIHQVRMFLDPMPRFIAYWTVTPRVAPWVFARRFIDTAFYIATIWIMAVWRSARGEPTNPRLNRA